jgi:hypothetical protein
MSTTAIRMPAHGEVEDKLVLPPEQLLLFPDEGRGHDHVSSTFAENMSLPVHRWFRYSAGFSALWVRDVVRNEFARGRRRLLDPFAGSGTALLEAERCSASGTGVEAHPFVLRVARAKLNWRSDPQAFWRYAQRLAKAGLVAKDNVDERPPLIGKCFPPSVLTKLDALKTVWQEQADGSALSELAWLALAAILRECSPVGTAQWQYVLPRKTKTRVADPFEAFTAKVRQMCGDMALRQRESAGPSAQIHEDDARKCASIPDGWADLVITSPPYANNYDYADATRLEMCFFGEVGCWGDLQETVRKRLIRACTQHVAALRQGLESYLSHFPLPGIEDELRGTCGKLEAERDLHGGRKPYHLMVAAYFRDMAESWCALRRVCANGCLVCFVVGDSAPYGVYLPVDRWLGELALAAGFRSYHFEKTRDRNVKWKNRKHRVPLHEGRLWVEG